MVKRNLRGAAFPWLGLLLLASLVLAGCQPPAGAAGAPSQAIAPLPATPAPTVTAPAVTSPPTQPAPTREIAPATATLAAALNQATLTPTALPTAPPTRAPCWSLSGRVEEGSLRYDSLPLPLEYRVYLPPCYDAFPEQRYPVLYLLHGQNYNNDQWDRLGADETATRLIATGEITPFIIVMPRDRLWAQPTEDHFGEAVVEALIPYIDESYRTLPDRQHRAVGGLSRGASWALNLGFSHWELFGAIGMHSLPVFYTDTFHIRDWLDAIPPDQLPRIYLDTGEKDYLIRSTLWFENLLVDKGIPHEWHLFPGYHEEKYWEAHTEQYLRWYAVGFGQ